MATLTLQDEQVLDLVRQLPDARRAWLFQQLLRDEWPAWVDLPAYAGNQVTTPSPAHRAEPASSPAQRDSA